MKKVEEVKNQPTAFVDAPFFKTGYVTCRDEKGVE